MILAAEMGHKAKAAPQDDPDALLAESETTDVEAEPRPPVVTVMGHVDHGKTSLLDTIRRTRVASGEAGGITQHIGAYHVQTKQGRDHVPRHAGPRGVHGDARARREGHRHRRSGRRRRRRRDAADEGSDRPREGGQRADRRRDQQGRQARSQSRAREAGAGRRERDPGGIRRRDAVHPGVGEDRARASTSCSTRFCCRRKCSSSRRRRTRRRAGIVIESRLDKGKGPVATVLVHSGTLKRGDIVLAGAVFGRVRAMTDENGKAVSSAGPAIPVEIQGLSDVPLAGEDVMVLGDERKAREIALFRQGKFRDVKLAKQQAAKLENMFDQMAEDAIKSLALIVKADVQGSYEALDAGADEALDGRGQGQHRARGGGRHHRVGRQPGARVEGGRHRLQCPRRRRGAQARRAQRRGHPLLQHHLRRGRRGEGRAVRHARARQEGERRSGWSRCARSTRSPRSGRSPAATCSTAWSSAARACGSCATTS